MYKKLKPCKTTLNVNTSYQGETIEQKVSRIVNNKEPIKDGAPIIFTDRKDGVNPAHDIRTDRWELAADAMDKVNKDKLAKREGYAKQKTLGQQAKEGMKNEKESGGETSSIPATGDNNPV